MFPIRFVSKVYNSTVLNMCIYMCTLGEGNGTPLQYSCLENPMDRGAWWAAIYGVAQSLTRLKWLSSSSSSRMCTLSLSCVWFLRPCGPQPSRLLCSWNFPGENTAVGCHFLRFQGIFPTEGVNPRLLCLLHWQAESLQLHHLGSPMYRYM